MNLQGFIDSLSFMGIGMASIIIVIGVLILAVLVLNLFSSNLMKPSRKVILVVAFLVLLVSLSLFNGMRADKKVKEYVEGNKDKIFAVFENNMGISGLEAEIEVQGKGFIITFIDEIENISDKEKAEAQKLFDGYEPYFEQMLTEIKQDIKELETYEFRLSDKNGEIIISVIADGK